MGIAKMLAGMAAAAATILASAGAQEVYDPWEGWNRKVFALNNAIDRAVLEPTALGYRRITPKPARRSLRNFLNNLGSPVTFVNDVLQLKPKRAGKTLGRFLMNSTLGVGGLFDPASQVGMKRHTEDFGQTLARYGVPPGPYMMIPFLGPSNLRDGPAFLADNLMDPSTYIATPAAGYYRLSTFGANTISLREQFQDPLVSLRENSLDFYTSYQSFFVQARLNAIRDGKIDYDALPPLDDFDDFDDFEDFDDLEEDLSAPADAAGATEAANAATDAL